MRARSFFALLIRISALALLGLGASAFAQSDPPGRIGRINYSEGAVSFAPAGDDEFTDADLNRPLSPGDKLWTDKGVRADLQVGSAAVRMEGRTHLTVLALNDQSTQLSVTQGTVFVRVRTLPEGENFEIDTPNLAWRASYPGDYRIDVDGQRGTTRVTIHSGTGAVYGEKAEALPMGGGQQIIFKGRTLAQVDSHEQPPQDNFDRWAAERNRREDQSPAARYVPREVVGYQLLDSTGQWQQDANLGVVWFPQNVKGDWAPYRNGRWEWIAPWGWTWIDDAPWAFVTSHYGRWTQVEKKWAWVPGRMGLRPIYAPALVAFVGNAEGPLTIGGKRTVAWFPLAPGEAWQPTFEATPLYISTVNTNMPPVQQGGTYTYQHKPEALTAVAVEDFQRGKRSKGSWLRVATAALSNAQVVAPPAMPESARAMVARMPSGNASIKQAVNKGPTAAQQLEMQRQADAAKQQAREQVEAQRQADEARKVAEEEKQAQKQAQKLADAQALRERERLAREEQQQRAEREQAAKVEQARTEQPRRTEQAKAVEQQRAAEQQKLAKQKAAEQTRVAQGKRAAEERAEARIEARPEKRAEQRVAEQKAAEHNKRAEAAKQKRDLREQREAVAKRAEQAKREQVARREQAKREQVAALLREREARRELQAKRAQEAKRLAAAKKEDDARRIAHAQEVERSRRAAEREAQVLQAQRTAREEQIRRVSEEKEKQRAQQEAWARQQQALAEQWKRDQQAFEEQQRLRAQQRQRPDLRRSQPAAEPEVWQRGIPILNPGRTS